MSIPVQWREDEETHPNFRGDHHQVVLLEPASDRDEHLPVDPDRVLATVV